MFSSEVIDIYHAFEQGDDTEKRAICHDLNAILKKMTDAEQVAELHRISAYDSNVVVGLINECLKLS